MPQPTARYRKSAERNMLRVTHPQLQRYFAVLTAAGALTLTLILWPLPGTPVALFVAAVAFSAWYGGLGPGLLATALSAVATAGFLTILFARFGRSPPRKGDKCRLPDPPRSAGGAG
ncbi:MAG: DUF4118 domain-containing protein [Oscillatoria princeps RMCB-10]|nr:DUF4118 domain-containing protein [Oscillatoria princeps RMCB-10]